MHEPFLPLFPLPLVLLPHIRIPLHIYEDRYKEMIGEAIRDSSEFGIVLAAEGGILNTGCTAVVEQVTRRYPDGRMDIVVRGVRRFHIHSLDSEKSYLRATIEFFYDEEDDAPHPLRVKAANVARDFLPEAATGAPYEPSQENLSFHIAGLVEDAHFRQQLLSSRSESDRLERLISFIPEYVARRQYADHMRSVAPQNGHG